MKLLKLINKTKNKSKKTDNSISTVTEEVSRKSIVQNLSSETLSAKELNLLNKGLNYALPSKTNPKNDLIIEIEAAIQYHPFVKKQAVRLNVERAFKEKLSDYQPRKEILEQYNTIDDLKKKKCLFFES